MPVLLPASPPDRAERLGISTLQLVLATTKHRELRAAQPLALNQKEEKNSDNWHGPHVTSPIAPAPAGLWARMTLARHEPCQLLKAIVPQTRSLCWTHTIRLPYAGCAVQRTRKSDDWLPQHSAIGSESGNVVKWRGKECS